MIQHNIEIAIEERVDAILASAQHELGIAIGDVDPAIAMQLDETIGKLADVIIQVINDQKRYNKGDD